MSQFKIITLGCKVNQCESEALDRQLSAGGWQSVDRKGRADLCIINTCTVTGKAAMQSRQAIRRALREHTDARIIVTGCYARTEPETVRQINNSNRLTCCDKATFSQVLQNSSVIESNSKACDQVFSPLDVGVAPGRTRPFLKIQDGCDAFCTYCIVPYARGRSRSMPVAIVLDNLRELETAGYHETVLTGIHLGIYGEDLTPVTTLSDLLHQIEARPSPNRIRLSSIEPGELTDAIIEQVVNSDRLCHHFHIPLQSGDDGILERMGRPYTAALFRKLILHIADRLPDAALGVDTLIGFPGESEEAFENTFALIQALPISYLHVFPFSARPGTPAARYPNRIPPDIIKARCQQMRMLAKEKSHNFYRRHIDQVLDVLVENKRDRLTGKLKGLTSNYIPVLINGEDELKNRILPVRITSANNDNGVSGIRLNNALA